MSTASHAGAQIKKMSIEAASVRIGLGAERQAESGRKSEKKKGEWPLHSGWAGPGATFSGVSLSGLSHNDCRRRLLTNRSAVRILFGEPNYLTTNSLPFWLTARRHGLAGNGQYCAKGLSPVRQLDRYPPPDLARWPHSRAPFSVSPITSARLVNCQADGHRPGRRCKRQARGTGHRPGL